MAKLSTKMSLKHKITVAVYNKISVDGMGYTHARGLSSIDDLFIQMWKNTGLNRGMALTGYGLECLVNVLTLKSWEIDVDTKNIRSADLIMLDRYMTAPYFFFYPSTRKRKNLVLFDESTVAQLMLYNNDLKLFLDAQDAASNRPVLKG